ncbi:MAG: tyrosine-type recombinase/integrase [Candidatus Saganbacteria bacterium]|nr:tyrosine-type recombinase/integrase [Candidatus Saganbacteria bacterium]
MDDYSKIWQTEKNGVIYAIFRLNGKVKWEKIGEARFLSKNVIDRKKKEIMERLARGEYIEKKVLFENMVEEFLKYSKKTKTPGTFRTASGHCKSLLRYFKGYLLTKLTPYIIEGYIDYRREQNPDISNKTIINELFTLSAIIRESIKRGYLKENPVKRIERLNYTRPEMKFFTKQEIDLILANCSRYLRSILLVGLTTGLRKSEICHMKWENINFEEGIIVIKCDETFQTKNKRNRIAVLVPQLKEELLFLKDHWIDPVTNEVKQRESWQTQYVFCHQDGHPINNFANAFYKLMRKLGIKKASPHTMRHTFVTYHMNYGDPFLTQRMVGHSDPRVTQGYYHLQVERMRDSMGPIEALIGTRLPSKTAISINN